LPAQTPSRAEMAEQVENLQAELEALKTSHYQLLNQVETPQPVQAAAPVDTVHNTIVKPKGGAIKAPNTIEEANALLLVLLGFVQFVLTGFIPKERLPKWLSPFMMSVIIAAVVTVVGLTLGNLSLPDAIAFFAGVSGIGNIFHQIKKPKTPKNEKTV
jgi:hypothetical protein